MCIKCGCSGLDPPLWVLYCFMKVKQSVLDWKRGTPLGNRDVSSSLWCPQYSLTRVRGVSDKEKQIDG